MYCGCTLYGVERSGRGGCVEERRLATEEQTRRQDVYVPRCRTDGGYTDEQCHNATGYCWCVTTDGKPIPGSSIHGRQHNCAVYFSGKTAHYAMQLKDIAEACTYRKYDVVVIFGERPVKSKKFDQ